MGGDSCSEGREFESWHHILDGHFLTIFVVKICNICLKRPKVNEKEAGVGPFKKRKKKHALQAVSTVTSVEPKHTLGAVFVLSIGPTLSL